MKKVLIGLGLVALVALVGGGIAYAAPLGQDSGAATGEQTSPPPWIGVAVVPLGPELAERLHAEGLTGVVVVATVPGGPAQTAGLQPRDLITAVNGTPVAGVEAFRELLHAAAIGQPLTLSVVRAGSSLSIAVTPQARPPVLDHLGQRPLRPPDRPQGEPGNPLMRLLHVPSLDRLVRAELVVEGEDGALKTVAAIGGTFVSATETSLTVHPKDGSADQTFALGAETRLQRGPHQIKATEIAAGERLIVVTVNSETRLVLVATLDGGFAPPPSGPRAEGVPPVRPRGLGEEPLPGMGEMSGMDGMPRQFFQGRLSGPVPPQPPARPPKLGTVL